MSSDNALIVRFPPELAGMSSDELQTALEDINRELAALALQRSELLKQKKLLEVVSWVLYPDTVPAGYQSVAKLVQARLRRARELSTGTGQTKNEEYREIAEKVTSESKPISHRLISRCCSAGTFEGERHSAGSRHCSECGKPCLFTDARSASRANNDSF